VEAPVENPRPPGGWEVQPGGARLPLLYGCGKTGAGRGGGCCGERGVWAGGVGMAGGVGSVGRGAGGGEEPPLLLPTPDFMASAGTP